MQQPSAQGIASLFRGNPAPLQQRIQQEQQGKPGLPPDLHELMALNIVTNEKDAMAKQQALSQLAQMQGPQGKPPTVMESVQEQARQKMSAYQKYEPEMQKLEQADSLLAGETEQLLSGQTADDAWFRRQGEVIDNFFLISDTGDALRHTDAEIHHAIGFKFESSTPGDKLAFAHRHRRDRLHGHLDLATEGRVVDFAKALPVVLGRRHHYTIDQNARDFDVAWMESTAFSKAFYLDDNHPPAIVDSSGDSQGLQRQGFLLHADIAIGIGRSTSQDSHVNGKGLVE